MIVKIHSRGAGAGSGPVDYLLGKERDRTQARVLRGHPERIRELIDTCDFARTYTSGVLSFEESQLPDNEKSRLMDEFEATLFPGLDKDQYVCLWVEHRDKNRLELNFVIPNIEMHSGKRLQPYYDRADRPRVNAWQTLTNDRLHLSDPNDPQRRRVLTPARDLPRDRQKAAETITTSLSRLISVGEIRDRADVLTYLRDSGLTIARETRNSISIADPDGGKNLRLKGAIYERDFRFSEKLRDTLETQGETYRRERAARVLQAGKIYQRGLELKCAEHQERYPRRDRPPESPAESVLHRSVSVGLGQRDRPQPDTGRDTPDPRHDDQLTAGGHQRLQPEPARPEKTDGQRPEHRLQREEPSLLRDTAETREGRDAALTEREPAAGGELQHRQITDRVSLPIAPEPEEKPDTDTDILAEPAPHTTPVSSDNWPISAFPLPVLPLKPRKSEPETTSGHESPLKTPQNVPYATQLTSDRESYDRNGKTALERFRAITERLRETTSGLAGKLQRLANDVRDYLGRDESQRRTVPALEQASDGLETASRELKQQYEELHKTMSSIHKVADYECGNLEVNLDVFILK